MFLIENVLAYHNQIVKKQFSSYDMSVKEISLFGIRHFPILLLVASPTEANKRRNQSPTINQEPDFITFVSKNQNHPHFLKLKEIIEIVCEKKKEFCSWNKKKLLVLIHPIHQCFINPSIHSYNKQPIFENHLTIHTISHH